MSETATQRHNRVAREAVKLIAEGCHGDEVESMIIVESLVFGFLTRFRPVPSQAVEFLDVMTERIVQRINDANVNQGAPND